MVARACITVLPLVASRLSISCLTSQKTSKVSRGFDAENDRLGCDNGTSSQDLEARVNYFGPLQSTIYLSTFVYTIVCIGRYLSSTGALC